MYLRMRPKNCPLAQSDNLSAGLHNNSSQQMATNTKNYIAMTFHKRLSRYVKHRYKLDGAQTHVVMNDIYALHYTGDNAIVKDLRQKIPQRAAVGNFRESPSCVPAHSSTRSCSTVRRTTQLRKVTSGMTRKPNMSDFSACCPQRVALSAPISKFVELDCTAC